tara:strand:+ start:196 stop:981 length:786 start_codon:yes stop_codon:yes gene_type:complete
MEEILLIWLSVIKNLFIRYFLFAGGTYFVFYILFKNRFVQKKIQKRYPTWNSIKNEILHSFFTILIFGAVATLVIKQFVGYTHIYQHVDEHGVAYLLLTVPLMFLIHDTYFYWLHRLMHHPLFFKRVHLVHHYSTNPTPFSAYSFHPLEAILESAIIPLIAFTLPVHKTTLIFFLLFQFAYNVYGHLGYELYPKKFHQWKISKWINTSVAHNMHHRYSNYNYGLYFLFWDRIMGTLHQKYGATYEQITDPKEKVKIPEEIT